VPESIVDAIGAALKQYGSIPNTLPSGSVELPE
jgi:hypothetical protein